MINISDIYELAAQELWDTPVQDYEYDALSTRFSTINKFIERDEHRYAYLFVYLFHVLSVYEGKTDHAANL